MPNGFNPPTFQHSQLSIPTMDEVKRSALQNREFIPRLCRSCTTGVALIPCWPRRSGWRVVPLNDCTSMARYDLGPVRRGSVRPRPAGPIWMIVAGTVTKKWRHWCAAYNQMPEPIRLAWGCARFPAAVQAGLQCLRALTGISP